MEKVVTRKAFPMSSSNQNMLFLWEIPQCSKSKSIMRVGLLTVWTFRISSLFPGCNYYFLYLKYQVNNLQCLRLWIDPAGHITAEGIERDRNWDNVCLVSALFNVAMKCSNISSLCLVYVCVFTLHRWQEIHWNPSTMQWSILTNWRKLKRQEKPNKI